MKDVLFRLACWFVLVSVAVFWGFIFTILLGTV